MLNWPQGQVEPSIPRYFLDRGKLVIRSHNDCARHCLDHFLGCPKEFQNRSKFIQILLKCDEMLFQLSRVYSKSVKTELQDSFDRAKLWKGQRKIFFGPPFLKQVF